MPDRPTLSLIAFIEARLSEREASARLASPGPWHLNDEGDGVLAVDDIEVVDAFALSSNQQRNTARHIAANDPAYVLADIAAKRAVLAVVAGWKHEVAGDCWYTCAEATEERDGGECCDDDRRGTGCDCGRDYRVLQVLRPLAAPFASHDAYDQSWSLSE